MDPTQDNPYEEYKSPKALNVPVVSGISGYGGEGTAGLQGYENVNPYTAMGAETANPRAWAPEGGETPVQALQTASRPSSGPQGGPPAPPPGPPPPGANMGPGGAAAQALEQMRAKGGIGGYLASQLGYGPPVGVMEGWRYGSVIPTQYMPLMNNIQQTQGQMAHMLYGEQLMRERLDLREQEREKYEEHQKTMRAQALEDTLNANPEVFSQHPILKTLFDDQGRAHVSPFAADRVSSVIEDLSKLQTQTAVVDQRAKANWAKHGYTGPEDPKFIEATQAGYELFKDVDPVTAQLALSASTPEELARVQQRAAQEQQRADLTARNSKAKYEQIGDMRMKQIKEHEAASARLLRISYAENPWHNAAEHNRTISEATALYARNETTAAHMENESRQLLDSLNTLMTTNKAQKAEIETRAKGMQVAAAEIRVKNAQLNQQIADANKIMSSPKATAPQPPGKIAIPKDQYQRFVDQKGAAETAKRFIQSGQ